MKKAEAKQRIQALAQNKTVRRVLLIALCAVVALLVLRLLLLLFPVKEFEIKGDTKYELSEVINAAGIRKGDRLYGLNKSKAEKALLEKCPYILQVKIKAKFPNKVCFEIEERASGWYMQIGDDFYALDHDLKVLMETNDGEMLANRGLTKLILPELQSAICGQYPEFGNEDERLISETLKIIDAIRTRDIKDRLNFLDLSNRFRIKMTVDETYTVDFGDMDNAETKFDMINKIIADSKKKGYIGGEINVIDPSMQGFRGYFAEQNETDGAKPSDEE